MLLSGPSGFHNAPISKAIFLFTSGASILISVMGLHKHLSFHNLESLTNHLEIWRPLTHQLFFRYPGELLFGSVLMYEFRMFERLMGSAKFAGMVTISGAVFILAQLAAFVIFPHLDNFTTGPYSFIFSSLVLYYFDIPVTHRVRIFGRFTSSLKIFVYILSLQLLFSNFPTSLIAGFCGMLGGWVYRSEIFGFKKFTFPRFICNFCSRFILPQLQSAPRRTRLVPPNPSIFQQPNQQNAPIIPPMNAPPRATLSEESIQMLTDMGFTRDQVVQALNATHGDVELATNMLLDSSS